MQEIPQENVCWGGGVKLPLENHFILKKFPFKKQIRLLDFVRNFVAKFWNFGKFLSVKE